MGNILIGTSEDGKGVILFGKYGPFNHEVVDRSDGSYTDWGDYRSFLRPQFFKIYESIAQEIETGEPGNYVPASLSSESCSEAYARAQDLMMLRPVQTLDGDHQFEYAENPSSSLFEIFQVLASSFSQMNLDEKTVFVRGWRERNRPIHPDFAEFLKQKKAELDQSK